MLTDEQLEGFADVKTASGRPARIVKVLNGDRQGVLAEVVYFDTGDGEHDPAEKGEEWVFASNQAPSKEPTRPPAPLHFNSAERQILSDALKTYLDCFLSSDTANRTKISELIKRVESI